MKKKVAIKYFLPILILIGLYFLFFQGGSQEITYTFGKISIGNLNVVITSTGTLEATSTVDVGTQVSGKISKIFVDFNSEVRKGQLLAIIDTVTLVAQIRDAQANLAKAKAEYKQKVAIHERNKKLYAKNFISELDFIQSQTDVESSSASLSSAESALERANTNLGYAYIYAPIAGKIINRAVEVGQTVAASLSAPTLFTIAEDLSSMRILANVDESDIGQIKEGQKVKFTVQAYSDKKFDGEVKQIRLKSSTSSNVVSYTVVIHAPNSEKLLLPGMTATVDFYVDYRENVLLVPNTALRFDPPEALVNEIKSNMEKEFANRQNGEKDRPKNFPPPPPPGMNGQNNSSGAKPNMSKIFFVNSDGKYVMTPVITGLTDGKNTEIIAGRGLKEGIKVITCSSNIEAAATTKSSNSILQTQQNMGGGGPPPPPM